MVIKVDLAIPITSCAGQTIEFGRVEECKQGIKGYFNLETHINVGGH